MTGTLTDAYRIHIVALGNANHQYAAVARNGEINMRLIYILLMLLMLPVFKLSAPIRNIETCKLSEDSYAELVSLQTIDGDAPYLVFGKVIVNTFLDGEITSGEIVLSECIGHSLIFAVNYGSPYIKGCLITVLKKEMKEEMQPVELCFAERNTPDSVWFGKNATLIIIKNDDGVTGNEWVLEIRDDGGTIKLDNTYF